MKFNPEQEQAIFSEKNLVVISAGAGSGKTRVLTERYVFICEQHLQEKLGKVFKPIGATVEEIVAITFTEKAAREMKDRIRGRVEEKRATVQECYEKKDWAIAEKFWQEQKEALDGALITTFHSFCSKLLSEHAFEAEITPSFRVLDDVQSKLLQLEIFQEMFDSAEFHHSWKPLYQYYTQNQLREAIKSVYSQMKEIITSHDSIELFFDSETIVQLQLATIEQNRKETLIKFYKEARPYVMSLEAGEKTTAPIEAHFHSVGDNAPQNPTALYADLELAMPKKIQAKWKETNPSLYELYETLYKPLKETWKLFKGPTDEELIELKEIIRLFSHMLSVFHQKYDEAKRERAAMDFSDLQQKAINLLEKELIQENCRKKYKHMMIDEFQDTNNLQMNMLTFIQPTFQFVVGDGKQSIYRFRGADVSLMKELIDKAKKSANSDFINMSLNYRTCDSIIQFVNLAFQEIMGSEEGEDQPSYKINYTTIHSHRNGADEQQARVELIQIPQDDDTETEEVEEASEQSEYEVMTNRMLEIMAEKPAIVAEKEAWRAPEWRDFAILIQARTKLTKLEKALKDKKIPYVVYGGIGFYDKQEVRDILSLLQWLNRPWEPLYILSLLRSPLFQVSVEGFLTINDCLEENVSLASYIYEGHFQEDQRLDDQLKWSLAKMKSFYEKWVPFHPQQSIREYVEDLFVESGLKEMLLLQRNNIQQVRNVEKLINVLSQFQTVSLDELLSQIKQLAALSEKEGEAEVELAEGNMVHIMTVHASKGLEFPIVFLPDLAKGPKGDTGVIRFDKDVRLVLQYEKEKEDEPLKSADKKISPSFNRIKAIAKDQAIEEAKRLFYVAVTRAKDYLVMTTIDKAAKNSWYEMVQHALEENGQLHPYVKVVTDVSQKEKWMHIDEEYSPPKLQETLSTSISFSVSEVMTFINDPLKYYYKYVVKAEDHWMHEKELFGERSSISGATLGTIVHRTCELIDYGYPIEEAKKEALAIIEDEFEQSLYEQELDLLVGQYPILEKMNLGNTIANEWSFSVELDGAEIIGEIDKVIEQNGEIHLIDLKTNKSTDFPALMEYYAPQLYLYKLAYEKEMQQPVKQLSLFFMRSGQNGFCSLPYCHEAEEKVRLAIKQMIELRQKSASKTDYFAFQKNN